MAQRILVGTAGWSYPHWRGNFYPAGLAGCDMLAHYARHFRSVEINSSFYRLPSPGVLAGWRGAVPDGFVFAVKASRYITHQRKLRDCAEAVDTLLSRIGVLGDRVGPVLFQLPPRWHFDGPRLAGFLAGLDTAHRYAFEFRDHSWLNPAACKLLARHDAALCIYDLDGFESPAEITTDFVYVRLHGPAGPYQGSYDDRALAAWAARLAAWARQGLRVYCYLDNDQAGHAAANALALRALLDAG